MIRPGPASVRSDRVRFVRSLARRTHRERSGLFLAEGPQAVREAAAAPARIREVYLTEQAAQQHPDILAALDAGGVDVATVSPEVMAAMSDTVTPQQILAICWIETTDFAAVLAARPRLIAALSNIRDPGNAGTVIRVADAAGADAVLASANSVDVHNPKCVRATVGSLFHLPILTGIDVAPAIAATRSAGMRILAADGAGETDVFATDLTHPTVWLFGNEAHGLSAADRALADQAVAIPIYGKAESLNLATAAAVCLYASAQAQRSGL